MTSAMQEVEHAILVHSGPELQNGRFLQEDAHSFCREEAGSLEKRIKKNSRRLWLFPGT